MSSPTYRYGIAIFGASYAQSDHGTPEHFWMAETLSDVRRILGNAADNYSWRYDEDGAGGRLLGTPCYGYDEDGAGGRLLDTPGYGYPGDGAYIYRVNREDPDFSEVLDEPGDRARHAWGYLLTDYPSHRAEFGPRGGITIVRN